MNEAGGSQMIMSTAVLDTIRVHILNHQLHLIYQIHRNECRQATTDEIVQCTIQVAIQKDGAVVVAKGKKSIIIIT